MTAPAHASPTVAVVDIGSNSIKLLVATRAGDGSLQELAQHAVDARIGTGITGTPPRLAEEPMTRALATIQNLLATAARFSPTHVRIVATSAVRDAANRVAFTTRVQSATGHAVQVLSGEEEAQYIGRGIACEPALRDVPAFYLFDLGGGSLELLTVRDGRVTQAASLPLGCVRVTEACVADPAHELDAATIEKISAHVDAVIGGSGFRFDLPVDATAVATGGTATTVRAMRAAAWGRALAVESPVLAITELRRFAAQVSEFPLDERRRLPGLPEARADVFPAAVITLLEVARLAGVASLRHSLYNLRYGIAAEVLETQAASAAI